MVESCRAEPTPLAVRKLIDYIRPYSMEDEVEEVLKVQAPVLRLIKVEPELKMLEFKNVLVKGVWTPLVSEGAKASKKLKVMLQEFQAHWQEALQQDMDDLYVSLDA